MSKQILILDEESLPAENLRSRLSAFGEAYLAGGNPGAWVYSGKVEFVVNKSVAAALGLAGAAAKADSTVE